MVGRESSGAVLAEKAMTAEGRSVPASPVATSIAVGEKNCTDDNILQSAGIEGSLSAGDRPGVGNGVLQTRAPLLANNEPEVTKGGGSDSVRNISNRESNLSDDIAERAEPSRSREKMDCAV